MNIDDEISRFEISDFLFAIYDLGLSDLITISSFLERLDDEFRQFMYGNEAYRVILENLDYNFGLPNLSGLTSRKRQKDARRYISSAHDFYSYNMFLEDKSRRNALRRVSEYWKHQQSRNDEEGFSTDKLDPFASLTDLVEALQDYIENRTEERVPALKQVDFTFILDDILGFKGPSIRRRTSPQELGATCQKCS